MKLDFTQGGLKLQTRWIQSYLRIMPNYKEFACIAGHPGLIPGLGRSPGEGHGNPLQYSCLENPRDRGAWWAKVHGVIKIRTWQRKWHFHLLSLVNKVSASSIALRQHYRTIKLAGKKMGKEARSWRGRGEQGPRQLQERRASWAAGQQH